jgi:hypothetical protein
MYEHTDKNLEASLPVSQSWGIGVLGLVMGLRSKKPKPKVQKGCLLFKFIHPSLPLLVPFTH